MASCTAYRARNGVIDPSLSAGSSQRGARGKWTAKVICPPAAGSAARAGNTEDTEHASRIATTLMAANPLAPGGGEGQGEGAIARGRVITWRWRHARWGSVRSRGGASSAARIHRRY